MRKLAGFAALICGGAILAACSSTPDRGGFQRVDSGERPDLMVVLGMRAPPRPNIEYRPRSPLVLPGNTARLPPPENLVMPSDFPVDPEVELAARRADNDRALVESQEDVIRRGGIMTPAEVEDWGRRVGSAGLGTADVLTRVLTPREMRARQLARDTDPTVEPERQGLYQPPEGYRRLQPDENGNLPSPAGPEEQEQRRWWQIWR